MANRVSLTEKNVDAFRPIKKGVRSKTTGEVTVKPIDYVVWDTKVGGFGVRVTRAGTKSYILNYLSGGRERRLTIGKCAEMGVAAARDEAVRLKGEIRNGRDPLEEKEASHRSPTMGSFANRYLEEYAKIHKRERSVDGDELLLKKYILPKLEKRKLTAIRKSDVQALHGSMRDKPYQANRTVALLKTMFNKAIEWDLLTDNPCDGLKHFQEQPRERYLTEGELERIEEALDHFSERPGVGAIRLMMATGCRRGEALACAWGQIDFERGVWTKPSHHTKQKRDHKVPLSDEALDLLKGLAERAEKNELTGEPVSPYVFPGRRKNAHMTSVKDLWREICVRAGLAEVVGEKKNAEGEKVPVYQTTVRIHDLRHTFATYVAAETGSLQVTGALLGHTQAATTHRYAHALPGQLRNAANAVGDKIRGARGRAKKLAKVVSIRGKKSSLP